MRLIAKTVMFVSKAAMGLAAFPFLLIALLFRGFVSMYRWAELHGVYNGNKARQDRARYLNRIF